MEETEQAGLFAIAETKSRGLAEVGPDELLLGCLRAISRFGIVSLGSLTIDLEELGILWLEPRDRPVSDKAATKVAYSRAVVDLFDRAARIAKVDGASGIGIEHLLVAFAGFSTFAADRAGSSGLMQQLQRRYGITSAGWREAVAAFASARPPNEPSIASRPALVAANREYLTPEEAAEALGIHVQTLRGYVRSGKLPAMRLAGERALRIRRLDLEAVLEPLAPSGP